MANEEQLSILKQGVEVWNQWREANPEVLPDLSGADLRKADLSEAHLGGAILIGADLGDAYLGDAYLGNADLSGAILAGANVSEANLSFAHLSGADLSGADLRKADLSGAILREADLRKADLAGANVSEVDLSGAILREADLTGADLSFTDLSGADLSGADLTRATLVSTSCEQANLTGCRIYGISAWDVNLTEVTQTNLVITEFGRPIITVDNLEVAQFIYLLLNNQKIRQVIDTVTSKVVLILGRFTEERKMVLDAIREELRNRNYLPILFDFEGPTNRDVTETVSTLAHMARFIIADITEAKSIPQELQAIVPHLPSVPVQPLLQSAATEYGMFEHFTRYPWVLPIYRYEDQALLLTALAEHVVTPAEKMAKGLQSR